MYDSDAERPDDYLGRTEFALRLRGLDRSGYLPVLTQGGAMRERDLKTMDLDAPALVEPLMRNDAATKERLAAALWGHNEAQRIVAELVDIEPVKDDDDEDDFTADE